LGYSGPVTRSQTVRVATCHDQAEATLIRAILSAHGIVAMIPGGGASAGVAAVGFMTHVFVDREDAEEAAELIAEMRAAPVEGTPEDEDDADDEREAAGKVTLGVALERRTRIPALVVLSVMIGFGTAHMVTGAWKRGLGLAALEIVGIRMLWDGSRFGAAVVVAAVLLDLTGSIVRAYRRASPSSRLPVARLRESASRDPR
jgi:hypothetical protein